MRCQPPFETQVFKGLCERVLTPTHPIPRKTQEVGAVWFHPSWLTEATPAGYSNSVARGAVLFDYSPTPTPLLSRGREWKASVTWKFIPRLWDSLGRQVLGCKKGSQERAWIFWSVKEETDAEAEAPILWPPDAKNWLTGKDLHAGKDWRQEEKGITEDETVGWHHGLAGHEFEQAPGVGDGQGGLVCCSPWDCKESDTAEWLNWTELIL